LQALELFRMSRNIDMLYLLLIQIFCSRSRKDLIKNLPQSGNYEALKARIMSEFQLSEAKRWKGLLDQAEFGDQRPSRALRCMRDLVEGKMLDNLLKALWMQRLSTTMQISLTGISEDNLNIEQSSSSSR